MAETVTAPSIEIHTLAKCCWCGSPFVRGLVEVLGFHSWTCPQEACWRRQLKHAQIYDIKSGKRKGKRCRFIPLPRQVEAIEAYQATNGPTYIMIGGAAGGSKSKGLREIAHASCMRTDNFRVLLLRRTFKELESNHILDAQIEAPEMEAECVPSAKVVRYQNGSTLQFGHCETAADAANYLSSEYDLIIFDELVTFEEVQFLLISSRARSTKAGIVPKVMAGTNPGGPQSHWVRQRFIDNNVNLDDYPDYDPADWRFIPSKLEDNPYLDRNYEKKLMSLPPEMRKAYRDGDWDIFPGQYFPEWRKATHVADIPVPDNARWFLAIDGGFIKPAAFLWIAMFDGHAYVRHEWNPVRVLNSDQAKDAKRFTKEYGIQSLAMRVADTSLWTPEGDTGESAAETFARHGMTLTQATKDRVNGWKRLREWLAVSPDGRPWLMAHPDCTYLIRTLPSLISAKGTPEDVNTDGEDHSADALRYFVMARPSPGGQTTKTPLKEWSLGWLKSQGQKPRGILAPRSTHAA